MRSSSRLALTPLLTFALTLPLAAQAPCPTPWRLEETLRLGSLDGADALTGIADVELDTRGNIYIAQYFVPWISVFDPGGKPSERIGRGGDGPGEFALGALELGWKADTLWATDSDASHLFGAGRRPVAKIGFQTPARSETSIYSPGHLLADGSLLGQRSVSGRGNGFQVATRLPLLRFSRAGQILDTIAMIGWTSARFVEFTDEAYGRTFTNAVTHPLQDWWGEASLPVAATADGSAVVFLDQRVAERRRFSPLRITDRVLGPAASFELIKIGLRGDTLLRRSISYRRRRITETDQDWLRDAFVRKAAGEYHTASVPYFAPDAASLERYRDAITFPEYFPPVRQIVTGHDGTIWLLREHRPDRADLWEIYDGSGRLEGTVLITSGRTDPTPWKPRLAILRATREEVWGVTVDQQLHFPTLHRYRVERRCR